MYLQNDNAAPKALPTITNNQFNVLVSESKSKSDVVNSSGLTLTEVNKALADLSSIGIDMYERCSNGWSSVLYTSPESRDLRKQVILDHYNKTRG